MTEKTKKPFRIDPWWVMIGVVAVVGGGLWYTNRLDDLMSSFRQSNINVGTGEVMGIYQAPQPDRDRYCEYVKGTAEERLAACLAELEPPTLSAAAVDLVKDLGASRPILVVGDALPTSGVRQDVLTGNAELTKALMGIDEEAAAAAVRDGGYRGVVVHRDLTAALDRDSRVMSRLARHDHLEWFTLRRVTNELMIYTVRRSSVNMPLGTGEQMLQGLRARLERRPVPRQTWNPDGVRLIGSMRLQGNSLATRHVQTGNLEAALDDLARKLVSRWEREVSPEGHGRLRDRLDDIRLELHIVMEKAVIEPRSRYQIFDIFDIGVDGMMFRHKEGAKNEKFTYAPGSEAMTRSHKSSDAFLQYAVKTGGWRDKRPWQDKSTRLYLIRSQHFMDERPGGGKAVKLYRGLPEVKMADLTDDSIRAMLIDGGEWWLYNMRPDGKFLYKYWPTQGRRSTDYNEVRHILAARDLADTWRYRNDDRYLAGSKKSMDWLMKYAVDANDPEHPTLPHPPKDSMLFRYPFKPGEVPNKPPNQKLGTVAVALLGWVAWAKASGDHSEDERIRRMAKFTLSQSEAGGRFTPYYVDSRHRYASETNDIVPGEAALALGEVADYFGELEWLDFYDRYLDYYEPWFRERARGFLRSRGRQLDDRQLPVDRGAHALPRLRRWVLQDGDRAPGHADLLLLRGHCRRLPHRCAVRARPQGQVRQVHP
jgi:hypothetical protein